MNLPTLVTMPRIPFAGGQQINAGVALEHQIIGKSSF
jgi:hypothetical protein